MISYLFSAGGLVIIADLRSLGVVLLGTLLRAVGVGVNWVFSSQLLLQLVPNRVRGRVFSTEFAMLTLMSAIGTGMGGWVLDNTGLGVVELLYWMTGSTLLAGGLWGLWLVFEKRDTASME